MPLGQAFVLGLVQGLAEFLPVSSSGHLILVRSLLKWGDVGGLYFDVALHAGTLVALFAYFWRDWLAMVKAAFGGPSKERSLFWLLVIATVPGAVVGKLLEKYAEEAFRNPILVGSTLAVVGLIMGAADRFGAKRRPLADAALPDALKVGAAQACAIVPGVSRAGSTMSAALALGFEREAAARLSFLMAAPIISGATLLGLSHLRQGLADPAMRSALIVGVFTSAVVGFAAIAGLMRYLRRNSFNAFVIYRVVAGLAVIALALGGYWN